MNKKTHTRFVSLGEDQTNGTSDGMQLFLVGT